MTAFLAAPSSGYGTLNRGGEWPSASTVSSKATRISEGLIGEVDAQGEQFVDGHPGS